MLDRQTEALYYPRPLLQLDAIQSVLCVAPHPDDEVFGCGGLLTQLASRDCAIVTLILSRGERARTVPTPEMALDRERESRSAAQVLGLPGPRFGGFSDREMTYAEPLIAMLAAALDEIKPQYFLLPSLSEPHPDHQAVALAGMAAVQRSKFPHTVLFYEVGAPLVPNLFVDISSAAATKWRAVGEFVSQLGIQAYDTHARAFASLRAFGLGPDCTAAEAYFSVEASQLRQQGAVAAMPHWPLLRFQRQLANLPQQLPLVSILVRSIDRPQIAEAIASIAVQTYSNIEIVVVNASGRTHSAIQYPAHRLSLQLVEPGTTADADVSCGRARAANVALRSARGELALFLDDDDLIAAQHIEHLVNALAEQRMAVAAYAGVRVEGPAGVFQRNYDLPWSRYRINAINFLPIHAVLFRMNRVSDSNLAFDESLPVLEDWDFWRKLAALGDFIHCQGITAVYRQGYGESGLGDAEHVNHWKAWHAKLIRRYVEGGTSFEVAQTLAWHAIELDKAQAVSEKVGLDLVAAQQQIKQLSLESQAALQAKDAQLEQFSRESQAALQAKEAQLEQFARESQTALQAKEAQLEQFAQESQAALLAKDEMLERQQLRGVALDQRLISLEADLRTMQSTLTWRVSAPFRKLGTWLKSTRT